ncbi:MAG: hypothetical protein LBD51_09020 [Bifidobacteriaceae bacterium]|jgi:cell division septal protein FtsQ|nr:hypothetical protein [Bifidobacteriaceae bacterium]
MSATPAARANRRAAPRPSAAPQLRLVAAPARSRGFVAYIASCLALLLGGSAAVLWLNTALAAGAFEIQELEDQLASYQTIMEATEESLTLLSEPAALAAKAQELGMVQSHASGYLVLEEGIVINPPSAATDAAADQLDDAAGADPAEADG